MPVNDYRRIDTEEYGNDVGIRILIDVGSRVGDARTGSLGAALSKRRGPSNALGDLLLVQFPDRGDEPPHLEASPTRAPEHARRLDA
jgi:hypothetical protein